MNVLSTIRLLLLAVALLLLAGCGAAATPTAPAPDTAEAPVAAAVEPVTSEESSEASSEETMAAEMRFFTNPDGSEIEIPVAPQRVVALSERDMDAALALGANVVGVVNGRGAMEPPRYLQAHLGEAVSVGSFAEPSPEAILTLKPDLILIGGLFPELEAQLPALQQIAPVAITYESSDDWRTALLRTAEALNKGSEGEAWLSEYDARAKEVETALGENAGAEISIVRFNPDGPVVMAPISFGSTIAESVGLTRPQAQVDIAGSHGAHSDTISEERLDVVDGDWIFVGYLNPDGAEILDITLEAPLVQALGAVQAGHVSTVDGAVWTTTGGPLAALTILDDIEAALGQGEIVVEAEPSIAPLPRTVVDANGAEVVIEDDSKIIALDGTVTEIVYALGAGDRLIATDASSSYPEAATQLPQVGYVRQLSAEPILGMAPTLILTSDDAGPPEAVAQLRESGVPVLMLHSADSLDDSYALIRGIAQALGLESKGEALIADMEAELAEAKVMLEKATTTPRVLFVYARGPETVSAAGSGTSIDVIFELAGVTNAVTEWEGYQPLTAEGAVTLAPDAILLFTTGLESVGGVDGLLAIPGLAETPAGAERRVHDMDGLLLTGLGPRIGEAVQQLIKMLHPELAQ